MKHFNISDQLRLSDVKRWHMVAHCGHQSVAEHTHNVVAIASAIGTRCNLGDNSMLKLIQHAIYHDLDESLTGDIAPPTKKFAKERGCNLNALIESNISVVLETTRWDLVLTVKLADLMESINWLTQWGIGRHANVVLMDLEQQLESKLREAKQADDVLYKAACDVWHQMKHPAIDIWNEVENGK